jgi:hypothetical protein
MRTQFNNGALINGPRDCLLRTGKFQTQEIAPRGPFDNSPIRQQHRKNFEEHWFLGGSGEDVSGTAANPRLKLLWLRCLIPKLISHNLREA